MKNFIAVIKKMIALPILLWFITGCAGTGTPAIPEADSSEAKLFLNKCTQCHSWPHPDRHTPTEWDHYLNLMEKRMAEKSLDFSKEDREIIRGYLRKHAR